MYRKIVFAVDADPGSEAALPFVTALARSCGAAVHVLHVERVGEERQSGEVRQLVKRFEEELERAGVGASGEVRLIRDGEIAEVIAKAAEASQADLVALGSHGRSDLGALLRGSVSTAVARRLDLPALVVSATPTPRRRLARILVGVDGSEASNQALDAALELAKLAAAEVRIVHVREIVPAKVQPFAEPLEVSETLLREAVSRVSGKGVEVSGVIRSGSDVGNQVCEEAKEFDADLVVLASRRPSAAGALLWGSVAHGVIQCARRPVLLTGRPLAASAETRG